MVGVGFGHEAVERCNGAGRAARRCSPPKMKRRSKKKALSVKVENHEKKGLNLLRMKSEKTQINRMLEKAGMLR